MGREHGRQGDHQRLRGPVREGADFNLVVFHPERWSELPNHGDDRGPSAGREKGGSAGPWLLPDEELLVSSWE